MSRKFHGSQYIAIHNFGVTTRGLIPTSHVTNFGRLFGQVTAFCMVVPNIVSIITEVSFSVHTKI